MFFMNEHVKIPPTKSSTYADWADKNGYKYYTFNKDFGTDDDNKGVASQSSFGIESCYGHGIETPSRKTPKSGAQPKRSTRRSTRAKDGDIQEEPKLPKGKRRSTRRSANSDKDGGR